MELGVVAVDAVEELLEAVVLALPELGHDGVVHGLSVLRLPLMPNALQEKWKPEIKRRNRK